MWDSLIRRKYVYYYLADCILKVMVDTENEYVAY